MKYQKTNEYKYSEKNQRWYRKETEQMSNGNKYTNYYEQETQTRNEEGEKERGCYHSCNQQKYEQMTK